MKCGLCKGTATKRDSKRNPYCVACGIKYGFGGPTNAQVVARDLATMPASTRLAWAQMVADKGFYTNVALD